MKNSKHSHDIVRQNDEIVKKSHRHDANLQKNSTLYFQVGLIVCLLAALGLLEMRFESTIPEYAEVEPEKDRRFEMPMEQFKVYVEPKVEVKPKTAAKSKLLINEVEIVDDDTTLPEDFKIDTPDSHVPESSFDSNSLNIDKPVEVDEVPFPLIEEVPIYPGCEDEIDNEARKKCMSKAITRLVQRKFNGSDIASRYGLHGKQRITVQFLIDKSGKVTDIKTRAPHEKLEDEAKRVVNKIPEMQPGIQRDKPVGVRYTLPIVFMVE